MWNAWQKLNQEKYYPHYSPLHSLIFCAEVGSRRCSTCLTLNSNQYPWRNCFHDIAWKWSNITNPWWIWLFFVQRYMWVSSRHCNTDLKSNLQQLVELRRSFVPDTFTSKFLRLRDCLAQFAWWYHQVNWLYYHGYAWEYLFVSTWLRAHPIFIMPTRLRAFVLCRHDRVHKGHSENLCRRDYMHKF